MRNTTGPQGPTRGRRSPPTLSKSESPRSKRRRTPLNLGPIAQRRERRAEYQGVEIDETVSFGTFALVWLSEREEEYRNGELALATWRSYRGTVKGVLVPTLGDIPLAEIDLVSLRELRNATSEIPARGNQALDLARRILAEAERIKLRPPGSIPSRRIRRHPEMASARPASPDAVKKVFAACDEIRSGELELKVCHPNLAAMFQVIALTGARPSEIRDLEWACVDREAGAHGVLRLKKHKTVRKVGEKKIVLSALARRVIDEQESEDPSSAEWVFPSYRKPSQPYRDVGKAWRRVAEYAGFPDLCMRDLRTGLATNAYDNGVPLEQIQEMLTHQSIVTTRRYTRISAQRVGEAYSAVEEAVFGTTTSSRSIVTKRVVRRRRRKGGR